ncbi:hypothetical protein SpCBS45565_g05324 [Spizellomyces sp. 'palustris']|nr:hypothetical protein SpCBS45565_g05324 [Spizellomyces sp. 'palustris']
MPTHLHFFLLLLYALASVVLGRPGGGWLGPKPTPKGPSELVPLDHIQNQPLLPETIHPTDLLVVTTLDGALHGVHRPTGRVVWSRKDDGWGPLVKVTDVSLGIKNGLVAGGVEVIQEPVLGGNVERFGGGMVLGEVEVIQESDEHRERDENARVLDETLLEGNLMDHLFPVGEEQDLYSQGIYIPEPTGNGDLYYYEPGKPIKKLPLPIKRIVDDNHAFMFGDYVFTGKKVNRLVAIDPFTGKIVRVYGGDTEDKVEELGDDRDAVYISRTQYILSMWDRRTSKLRFNITYGEFSAPHQPHFDLGGEILDGPHPGILAPPRKVNAQITPKGDQLDGFDRDLELAMRMQFDTPAVGAFNVGANPQGYHLRKTYPPRPSPPSMTAIRKTDAYVGYHNGSFYLLSSKNFPDMSHASLGVLSGPSLPASETDVCRSLPNGVVLPQCLVGAHTVVEHRSLAERVKELGMHARESIHGQSWGWGWVKLVAIVVVGIVGLWRWWVRRTDNVVHTDANKTEETEKENLVQLEGTDGTGQQDEADGRVKTPLHTDTKLNESPADEGISLSSQPETPIKTVRKRRKNGKASKKESPLPTPPPSSPSPIQSLTDPSFSIALPSVTDSVSDTLPTPPLTEPALPEPTGLRSLTVSDHILGYGSHGTVVYKGTFEGRDVAIKRLLLDFYDVADHEVKMLQESDDHPNVVRYYFREKNAGFMYIALELCPASLYDVIEKPHEAFCAELRTKLKPAVVLYQIMAGIRHLHSLKIVHRDIKPQNILVATGKSKNPHPRILISDFGLGKRLAEDQSFFQHTHMTAGGTLGWRAPECILSSTTTTTETTPSDTPRITKAIDVFSAGCVFYYILTNGAHPFGDTYMREMNILKGNFRLDKLDLNGEEGYEAKDLIRRMISKDPTKRPDASRILMHPYFWTPAMRLGFLQDASDRFEVEERDPPSAVLKVLERGGHKVIGNDWYRRMDRMLLDNLGKYRKYDGACVRDLLRALRNKKHHYQDLPPPVQKALGPLPEGFLTDKTQE